MTKIQAIETEYDGHLFRSRQEARWAVFFNVLGVEYQYEPQGFELENGTRYLPDFYLPNIDFRSTKTGGMWVEVKGVLGDDPFETGVVDQLLNFVEAKHEPIALFVGDVENKIDGWGKENTIYEIKYDTDRGASVDYPMAWVKCEKCGELKIEFPESSYMTCEICGGFMKGYTVTIEDPEIELAVENATKARFEHGESPNV